MYFQFSFQFLVSHFLNLCPVGVLGFLFCGGLLLGAIKALRNGSLKCGRLSSILVRVQMASMAVVCRMVFIVYLFWSLEV